MPKDTLQAAYKQYEPYGISKKEYYSHIFWVGISLVGFMFASITISKPFMASLGTGLVATAGFCFGLVWLVKQFNNSDPIEKRVAQRKEYEFLRQRLLDEIRDGKSLT